MADAEYSQREPTAAALIGETVREIREAAKAFPAFALLSRDRKRVQRARAAWGPLGVNLRRDIFLSLCVAA
ncbi:hypothetical protein [Actinoallomurus sp. CA-150999]|uniref:hypothetical protein n=1 Tax=Actinoallomurus sp. CA-150999 TaxID=3239887 RepID=UPI003D8E0457